MLRSLVGSEMCIRDRIKELELVCRHQSPLPTDTAPMVVLNVYTHGSASKFGLPVYHTGVEVAGREFSFDGHSGIMSTLPHKAPPDYNFSESIRIGLSICAADIPVEALSSIFSPENYCLVSLNCNHFSDALCTHLTGKGIPDWVNQLATKVHEVALIAGEGGSSVLAAVANATLTSSKAQVEGLQLSRWLQDEVIAESMAPTCQTLLAWIKSPNKMGDDGCGAEVPGISRVWEAHSDHLESISDEPSAKQALGLAWFGMTKLFSKWARPSCTGSSVGSWMVGGSERFRQIAKAFQYPDHHTTDWSLLNRLDMYGFCSWLALTVINGRSLSLVQFEAGICCWPSPHHTLPPDDLQLTRTRSELVVRIKLAICSALPGHLPNLESWLGQAPERLRQLYEHLPIGQPLMESSDPVQLSFQAALRIQRFMRARTIQSRMREWNDISTNTEMPATGENMVGASSSSMVHRWRSGSSYRSPRLMTPVNTPRACEEAGALRFGLRMAINKSSQLSSEIDGRGGIAHSQLLCAVNRLAEALQVERDSVLDRADQVCGEYLGEAESKQQAISMKAEVATVLCEEARTLMKALTLPLTPEATDQEPMCAADPLDSGLIRWRQTKSERPSPDRWDQHGLLDGLEAIGDLELGHEVQPSSFGRIADRWHLPVDRCQAALCMLTLTPKDKKLATTAKQDSAQQVQTFFFGDQPKSTTGSITMPTSEFVKADQGTDRL
eukprot:TRINITY_DN2675_c0_g1_i2.p1 TRINITY_DN2675_c0_g1~~TRINITY_DN2675_c0_g1_i2.p1  ORF type:complete len:740 (-),score=149.56 TRINITY_DN2675_c0_g1_i2:71-2245(-)